MHSQENYSTMFLELSCYLGISHSPRVLDSSPVWEREKDFPKEITCERQVREGILSARGMKR